ncbi:hypothetical protein WH47_09402 [Habropoda laboriosa]|uniref:Uncharacterized protein n=1 Tax=Habropoda laboriosa TaxID=597456 RepID=A0A0L7RF47_9HYME|nr:hypothetical protein WH47_09402 [Habropoda laboriosa]
MSATFADLAAMSSYCFTTREVKKHLTLIDRLFGTDDAALCVFPPMEVLSVS